MWRRTAGRRPARRPRAARCGARGGRRRPSCRTQQSAAHRHRGTLATGWPFVRWIRRLRPDPLRRLRLRDRAPADTPEPGRSSGRRRLMSSTHSGDRDPQPRRPRRRGLPPPWPGLTREAATANEDRVADRLSGPWPVPTSGSPGRGGGGSLPAPALLALAVVVGMVALRPRHPRLSPHRRRHPDARAPGSSVVAPARSILAGLVLAFLARVANGVGAGRRSRTAARTLRRQVEDAAQELVVGPRRGGARCPRAPPRLTRVRRCGGAQRVVRGPAGRAKTVNKLLDPPDQKQAE